MSVHAETDGRRIWLTSDFRHKDMVKLIPGARWDKDSRSWWTPLSWASCRQLAYVFPHDLTVGGELFAWASHELNERVNPSLTLRLATDAEGDPALYPFQRAGVRFLTTAKRALLGDEMGTGKTVQLAVTLRELPDAFPCLIVAPKSVKRNWVREIEKWCPGVDVIAPAPGVKHLREALKSQPDVVIINYENTWRHSRLAPYGNVRLSDTERTPKDLNAVPWRTVIVDEAHRVKDPKAKQTRAIWHLGHQPTVEYRYALTGTPIAKAPDDLWSVMHFIAPDEFPSKVAYVDRYCLQSWNPWGGIDVVGIRPEMKQEFFEIVDARMRRMPKDLVLPFLPPKLRSTRYVEMSSKQAKAYKQMEEQMIADLEGGDQTAALTPIVQRLRKIQFASAFAELDDEGHVRLSEPSNKVDELEDLLGELGEEQLVVFAQSRQLIELAAARLEKLHITHGKIVGGMTEHEREAVITNFQAGRLRVVLGTSAGGEGITLTAARHLVFLQRFDSMVLNVQAEDRIHRIGAEVHDHVHIIDMVTPDSEEERVIANLHNKLHRLQEIVRDRATLTHAAQQGDAAAAAKLASLDSEYAMIMGESV